MEYKQHKLTDNLAASMKPVSSFVYMFLAKKFYILNYKKASVSKLQFPSSMFSMYHAAGESDRDTVGLCLVRKITIRCGM